MAKMTSAIQTICLLAFVAILTSSCLVGCETQTVVTTEEPGGVDYMCTGQVVYLFQNLPRGVLESAPLVMVVYNFQDEPYLDNVGVTHSKKTVGIDIADEESSVVYGERLGEGDQMRYFGYRITVLEIRMPDENDPEPSGSVSVCLEKIEQSEATPYGTQQAP